MPEQVHTPVHTPGPWEADSRHGHMAYILSEGRDLAFVLPTDPQTRQELPVEANAALMAAAPELRQAVEALRHTVLCMATGPGWTPALVIGGLTFAEAALAKAGVPAPAGQWDFLKPEQQSPEQQ